MGAFTRGIAHRIAQGTNASLEQARWMMSDVKAHGCGQKRPPTFDSNRTQTNQIETDRGTLDWPQPRTTECTLHFLRDRLHLITWLPGEDVVLLRHFLSHYVDGLGLRPAHLHMAITSSGSLLLEHQQLLGALGVEQVEVQAGAYSDERRVQWINDKIAAVHELRPHQRNASISKVAAYVYVLVADHDELISFDCNVAPLLVHYGRVCAEMYDMLASDGTIAPVARSPHISVQYPIACRLRQTWANVMSSKTVLFHTEMRLRNPHNPVNRSMCHHSKSASIAHYTLTAAAYNFTVMKAQRHFTEAQAWSQRAVEARAANTSLTMAKSFEVTRKADFILCSTGGPPGTQCLDYVRLVDWMDAQQANPDRDISCICRDRDKVLGRQVPAAKPRLEPSSAERAFFSAVETVSRER